MKSSKQAPYATHDQKAMVKPKTVVKKPASTPGEKDQSSILQNEARKTRTPVKPSPQSAPYGTLHNQHVLRSSPVKNSTSKNAPFGTAQNVPAFRKVNSDGLSSPYGTSADISKLSKTSNAKTMAPWERNDSRYAYKTKTNANFGLSAPYATEPIK